MNNPQGQVERCNEQYSQSQEEVVGANAFYFILSTKKDAEASVLL